jgi:membrane protease YdiL (CAAX protease family)
VGSADTELIASNAREAQRSRPAILIGALVLGTVLLAATVRVQSDSAAFTILALLLAATWVIGAFASGPIEARPGSNLRLPSAVLGAVLIGVLAFLLFVVAAAIARHLPFADDAVDSVLEAKDDGRGWLVLVVALVNAVAEELFFRGALYTALRDRRPLVTATLVYVAVTAATGNVALVVAAVVMGSILTVERAVTRGVMVPVITHMTWSTLMLLALPH